MLKLLAALAILAVPLSVPLPAHAEGKVIPTGRGCTINPFDRTWRCIDFDHCTTKPDGTKVCPVTTGTYLQAQWTGGSTGIPTTHLPTPLKAGNLR